ncbi:C-terminal binding protein [Faecalispora anaeroviscerum]|uniref:C-terminal binding protein n=1 Tax=Faecalispora anaeroviscerum TaxID=2991836 RepID=UPI0024BA8EE1|nr:C-terminal binding protein [Faecalispora anaeroviscerum]
MKPLFWFIDEEWKDYDIETSVLRAQYPNCELKFSGYDYEHDLGKFGYRADAIIAQVYAQIPASTIERLQNCKGIAVLGGGYDRVDTAAAREKGIGVTNVQGYCAEDLADYVVAAIFHFYKGLSAYRDRLQNGEWGAQAVERLPRRISHSTLFVIGCGRIGITVAKRCQSLGMKVLGYDPDRTAAFLQEQGIKKVSLEDGLRQADYVSVNVRLDESTTGLLGEREFSLMKPSAYFINTARGAILKEEELIRALENGVIAGAALDVIAHEPPREQEPIFSAPNCVVTPHISYISQESFQELRSRAAWNAIQMLRGEQPEDLVN